MPVDQKERSAKSAKKREEFDEKELRHRLRLGTRQKLEELMQWNDIEEISEAVQNLILNAHALGPTLSFEAVGSQHHKVTISESVVRMLERESRRETARDSGDEVVEPLTLTGDLAAAVRLVQADERSSGLEG